MAGLSFTGLVPELNRVLPTTARRAAVGGTPRFPFSVCSALPLGREFRDVGAVQFVEVGLFGG